MNDEADDSLVSDDQEQSKKAEVVYNGLIFLRSLSNIMDGKTSMKVWDAMREHIPNDIQSEIFVQLLTGGGPHDNKIRISFVGPNKISIIRIVKNYGNLSLVDAKKLVDLIDLGFPQIFQLYYGNKYNIVKELISEGARAN